MKASRTRLANFFLSESEKLLKMGVRQPADDHFWGEHNAVIGVFLETIFN